MALVAGTDANAQNTAWNSTTFDSIGSSRGDELLAYIAKEDLIVENNGDSVLLQVYSGRRETLQIGLEQDQSN